MNFDKKRTEDEKKAVDAKGMTDNEIIEKIFIESGKSYFNGTENVSKSVAYFAVMIQRLSVQSDKLQKRMFWLNIIIAILTIVLLLTIPQVNKFAASFFSAYGHEQQQHQPTPREDGNDKNANDPN